MITILSFILFVLLLIVGKSRGFKTFILFYLSFLLIIFYISFMKLGLDAIILALIISILTTIVLLFGLNGYNVKTVSSFVSVLFVLLFIFIMTFIIGKHANIQGFSPESIESIGGFSFYINYDMTNLIIGIYVVSIIGTVIDTSISVSSALNEIYKNNPHLKEKELFESGMNIGRDILSTTINTLYFAVICFFIGFFLWHHGASFSYIINYKAFVQEVIKLLICFIGSILIIPITAMITSKILIDNNERGWFEK